MIKFLFLLTTLVLSVSASNGNAKNLDSALLYFACASCHGDNGEGSEPIHAPAIAGQHKEYLARQLTHYRDGLRGKHPADVYGKQMALMSINFQDDEIIDVLSTYISSMPDWQSTSPPAEVVVGAKALYQSCIACHGVNGEGNAALSGPKIGGLHTDYLEKQLLHYQQEVRAYSKEDIYGQQMRAMVSVLKGYEDISAVAGYIGTLSGLPE